MNSTPSIQSLMAKFSQEDAKIIRSVMLSLDYRNAEGPADKVQVLLNAGKNITIINACKAIGISTKTYYKMINHDDSDVDDLNKSCPNQLLTDDEEQLILDEIGNSQKKCNCMRGKDVKEMAQKLYYIRTGEERSFGKDWFYRFLHRYDDIVGKMKATSVDEDRGSLSLDAINEYIIAIVNALKLVTDLRLVLNMDESGFGKRPDYKKRRSCVFLKNIEIPPMWRADTDNYHVSWVCCINAACSWTRHMFITTRKTMDPDFYATFLNKFADFSTSLKGYLVKGNMIEWVQNILIPYVLQIRSEINNDNHPVVLIFDNLCQHLTGEVMEEIKKIEPVILVPLPAHSSHITQPCDASVFSRAKIRFGQLSNDPTKTKFTAKLLRIKNAIEQTLNEDLVFSSWKKCGFDITITDGNCSHIEFSEEFQAKLRSMAGA